MSHFCLTSEDFCLLGLTASLGPRDPNALTGRNNEAYRLGKNKTKFTKICKLSPVRSIGDNDFLRVNSWAITPTLVMRNYALFHGGYIIIVVDVFCESLSPQYVNQADNL